MTDWIPPMSVLTKERNAILHLVRLCEKYQARTRATTAALGVLAPENPLFAARVYSLSQEFLPNMEKEVEIEYRAIESALCHGTDYVSELLKVLERHQGHQSDPQKPQL